MNPFEFVKSINSTKQDLFEDPQAEKDYSPFIINRALSYFPDTVLYANEVNKFANIAPKKWQYDFLRHAIPKRQRFSKWTKKDQSDDLLLIQSSYQYSNAKAAEALAILSAEQLNTIKESRQTGGIK